MLINFESYKDRKAVTDPRMLLQPKGQVLHLESSSERERACGCKAPVPQSLMRLHAAKYQFTLVAPCVDCGEMSELDTEALHLMVNSQERRPCECDGCGTHGDVTRAEIEAPDGGVTWGYLCDLCIEAMDEIFASREASRLPW